MIQERADLHIHSTFSDGSNTPEELVQRADILGLSCIAITDHDSTEGILPAQVAATGLQPTLDVLSGTELTCYDKEGRELHVLAYDFDVQNPAVNEGLQEMADYRRQRVRTMVELLQQQGINISVQDVIDHAGEGVLGRIHVAKALVALGAVSSSLDAFRSLIGEGCPAYVPKKLISPRDIIALIHGWGAVAVLAHPVYYPSLDPLEEMVDWGLDGFEVHHPLVEKKQARALKALARRSGLLITGGSDTHGLHLNRPSLGGVTVPYHRVDMLRERAARYKQ